jgi:hypothetical protein
VGRGCSRRAAQTLTDIPTPSDVFCASSILPVYQLTQSERFREVRCRAIVATDAPQRLTARGPASSWLGFEIPQGPKSRPGPEANL